MQRHVLFPLQHKETFSYYKKHLASFCWTVEEIDLSQDVKDWSDQLNDSERHFIRHVLAFFAASDGIVLENLALRFFKDMGEIPEVRAFYSAQILFENIHSETYSLLIDTLIQDPMQKMETFNAVEKFPAIREKAQWCMKYIQNKKSTFEERLIAFLCVEGTFFSGSFCAIYWIKRKGILPGLCFSNELISRDEGLHCEFAVHVYEKFRTKDLNVNTIHSIFKEAVAIEKKFICESLPCALLGMNANLMKQYIEFVANFWLKKLNVDVLFPGAQNPFDFMEMISLQGKTNFFEKRVGEYQKAPAVSQEFTSQFTLDADF